MVLDFWARSTFTKVKVFAHILSATCALWPSTPSNFGLWCVRLRDRSCVSTQSAWWVREAHRVCVSYVEFCRKKLLSIGGGWPVMCVWDKAIYPYLFGHPFTLITDHKPLLGLLDGQRPTSPQGSARIRRWSLYMSMFEYTLKFRNTTAHANADALSGFPLPEEPAVSKTLPEFVLAKQLANSPVTADQIRESTRKDPLIHQVVQFVQQGWPSTCQTNNQLTPFFEIKAGTVIVWWFAVGQSSDCSYSMPRSCPYWVARRTPRHHPGCMFGGRISQKILRVVCNIVQSVSYISRWHQSLHCILGAGPRDPGNVYIWTTQVHLKER